MDKAKQLQDESGVILILFAILLVPLILMAALAIDSTTLATSHSQQREVSEFAALAALETFNNTDTSTAGTPQQAYNMRYRAAVAEAERVVNNISNAMMMRRGDGTPPTNGKLGDPSGIVSGAPNEGDPSYMGDIRAGTWWFQEPVGTSGEADCADWTNVVQAGNSLDPKCPCPNRGSGPQWNGACFEDNNLLDNPTRASSFYLDMKSQLDSPLKTSFARVAGQENFRVTNKAWSTIVPRRGVFLVDLSRSIVADTHRDVISIPDSELFAAGSPPVPLATEYAFRVSGSPCSGGGNFSIPAACLAQSGCPIVGDKYSAVWNLGHAAPFLDELENPRTAETDLPLQKHFKNDYQCVTVDADDNGTFDHYLIDTDVALPGAPPADQSARPHTTEEGLYRGAEPLTTVLGGINRALQVLEERAVAGDGIGVVFFDEEILEARIFPEEGLTAPGEDAFEELRELTTVDFSDPDYEANLITRLRAAIFPRLIEFENNGETQVRPANTDLAQALLRAVTMLTFGGRDGIADNYVAIFSDGLTNCSHDSTIGQNPYSAHGNFVIEGSDGKFGVQPRSNTNCFNDVVDPDNPNIVDDLKNHLVAMNEMTAIVSGEPPNYDVPSSFRTLKERGYKIHTFLVGDKVKPNNYVRPNLEGSACMNQEESASNGFAYAYGGPPIPGSTASNSEYQTYVDNNYGGSAGNSYEFPNQNFYNNATLETGGLWAPVRPACTVEDAKGVPGIPDNFTEEQCRDGMLEDRIDDFCVAEFIKRSGSGFENEPVGTTFGGQPAIEIPGIIENGALICDPRCRSTGDSNARNVERIYERNPYILVEGVPIN